MDIMNMSSLGELASVPLPAGVQLTDVPQTAAGNEVAAAFEAVFQAMLNAQPQQEMTDAVEADAKPAEPSVQDEGEASAVIPPAADVFPAEEEVTDARPEIPQDKEAADPAKVLLTGADVGMLFPQPVLPATDTVIEVPVKETETVRAAAVERPDAMPMQPAPHAVPEGNTGETAPAVPDTAAMPVEQREMPKGTEAPVKTDVVKTRAVQAADPRLLVEAGVQTVEKQDDVPAAASPVIEDDRHQAVQRPADTLPAETDTASAVQQAKPAAAVQSEHDTREEPKEAPEHGKPVKAAAAEKHAVGNTGFEVRERPLSVTAAASAVESKPAPTTLDIDSTALIDRVVKEAKLSLNDRRSEMTIRLEPEHLGKLHLKLTSAGDSGLQVKIQVENDGVRDILESHLTQLTQTLEGQGIKVDTLRITVHAASSGFEFQGNGHAFGRNDGRHPGWTGQHPAAQYRETQEELQRRQWQGYEMPGARYGGTVNYLV